MFVLMIARGFPTPDDPQWGCFEKDQAEAIAALGHKVVVASVDSRFRFRWRRLGITGHSCNGVCYYDSFFIPSAITDLLGGKKASIRCRKWQLRRIYYSVLADYGKPDIIYGQFFYNSYIALPVCLKENIPLVNIEHAARFNDEVIDKDSIEQSREVYRHTAANIAVSSSLRIALHRLFGIDAHVVYNVYGKEFAYTPSMHIDDGKVRFVTTGSLITRKGFDLLPKAFSMLNLPKDKWELNIIGDGEERTNLRLMISETGMTGNIHLLGSMPKTGIARILNQSDVFVLPSRNENFSVAVLEALACGLPVVASICGGIKECIDENNGLLFEVDDIKGLADALLQMYNHHKDYSRQAIADDCQARFSAPVIARQLTSLFSSLL